MIDSTGKKITGAEQKFDLDFALTEIRFFIKGFRNEKSDAKALNISKCIYDVLKEGSTVDEIKEYIFELQNYSAHTQSDAFVWNLVHIRRLQSKSFSKSGDQKQAAEYLYASAKLFEKICEINPSEYNLCCRIYEYINATIDFTNANMSYKNQEILAYCENLFKDIEESVSRNYFKTGIFVYNNLYLDYKNVLKDNSKAFESIKSALRYAWRLYKYNKETWNLDILCRYYLVYLDFEQCPIKEEECRLRTIISFIKSSGSGSSLLKRKLIIFEELLKKIEEFKNT